MDRSRGVQVESQVQMLASATEAILSEVGLPARRIDGIICAATTLDYLCPSNSSQLMRAIQIDEAVTFDLVGGCAEFLHGLELGRMLIESGRCRNVLVAASEVAQSYAPSMARYLLDLFIFGDSAGAVLLSSELRPRWQLRSGGSLRTFGFIEGEPADLITLPISVCKLRDPEPRRNNIDPVAQSLSPLAVEDRSVHNARMVALHGGAAMARSLTEALPAGIDLGKDVYVVPHQPGKMVIDDLAARTEVPEANLARVYPSLGNLSSASLPVALHANLKLAEEHEHTALVTVGVGMSTGAMVLTRV